MGSREGLRLYLVKRFRSGPPFLDLAAAAMFCCRSIGGVLFDYGSPAVTVFTGALALVYAGMAVRRFLPNAIRAAEAGLSKNVLIVPRRSVFLLPALPFAAISLLAFFDYLAAPFSALFVWPMVLIAASFFISIAETFVSAALVAVGCGLAAGFGFAGGRADAESLFLLGSAAVISAFIYGLNLAEGKRAYNETAERVEREHAISSMRDAEVEIAARIQRALLLDSPASDCRGLRLEAITVASNAVDGDFYGFVPYSPDSIDVLVGDVMGKGVPAALLGAALKSSFLRSSLHLLVEKPGILPCLDELVSSVHAIAAGELSNLESFATLQYARVDSRHSRLDFVDCGHTPILHYDSTMNVVWSIKGSDLPLGFTEQHVYTSYTVPLSENDRLVLYSDGITEAPNESGELFGDHRLTSIVKANASLDPGELVRRILNTAMYFTSSSGFRDDVTCIAFSIDHAGSAPARSLADFPTQTSALGAIRLFIERELAGTDSDEIDRILLAVSEAASNALRHGIVELPCCDEDAVFGPADACLDEDGLESADESDELAASVLRVELIKSETWKSIRLIYHGKPFAWYVPPSSPDIETLPEGGFGRALMAKAASSVLYASGSEDLQMVCLFFDTASWVGL